MPRLGAGPSQTGHRAGSRRGSGSAAVNTVGILTYGMALLHGGCGCLSLTAVSGLLRAVSDNMERFREQRGSDELQEAELFLFGFGVFGGIMLAIVCVHLMTGTR